MTFTGANPDIVERAAALAAVARDEAEAIERDRRLPDPLVEALRDAGLFHLWVPGELGGLDAGVGTFMEVVRTLSAGDAAAGWVVMIAAETNALAQWMPRATAEEIFGGDARPICVGTLNPPAGTLRPVEGGYVAEGRWPFGSGFPNADWLISRARLLDADGEPALDDRGQPQMRAFAVPANQAQLVDTWSVPGLAGTGSFDYSMHEVHVPAQFVFEFAAPWTSGPRSTLPIGPIFQVGHGAHAIGTARQAMEAFAEIAARPAWSERPASEIALAHHARGEAEALVSSAEAWLDRVLSGIWQRAEAGEPNPAEAFNALQLAVAHTVHACVRAADLLFEAAGAQSLYRSNRLERAWRDLRAAGQHLHAKDRHYADGGRRLLEPESQ
ncbi:MAG: hypothetical protein F4X80_04880 [Chloroflexi bacterium]|nr:hypothetical protein [Chloroflexota bacterium]